MLQNLRKVIFKARIALDVTLGCWINGDSLAKVLDHQVHIPGLQMGVSQITKSFLGVRMLMDSLRKSIDSLLEIAFLNPGIAKGIIDVKGGRARRYGGFQQSYALIHIFDLVAGEHSMGSLQRGVKAIRDFTPQAFNPLCDRAQTQPRKKGEPGKCYTQKRDQHIDDCQPFARAHTRNRLIGFC